jgi:hypothetical protein
MEGPKIEPPKEETDPKKTPANGFPRITRKQARELERRAKKDEAVMRSSLDLVKLYDAYHGFVEHYKKEPEVIFYPHAKARLFNKMLPKYKNTLIYFVTRGDKIQVCEKLLLDENKIPIMPDTSDDRK